MKRLSFFRLASPLDLAAVAAACGARLDGAGERDVALRAVAPLERAERDEVTAFFEGLDPADLAGTRAGACLVTPSHAARVPQTTAVLLTASPRDALLRLASVLHPTSLRPASVVGAGGIDRAARVAASARLEPNVVADPGAIVGDEAEIGSGTFLGAQCVIGAGVRIGRDCAIGAGAVLCHALVGDRVVIRSGARLGQSDGARLEPSLGRVIVQNDVVVGANAVIARGQFTDTVVGEGARLAALVVVEADAVIARGALVHRAGR